MKEFDLSKAKTPSNPTGLEVCKRNGETIEITKVIEDANCFFPIVARGDQGLTMCYMKDGKFGTSESGLDLMIKE
jgi:hypothetical protein